MFSSNFEMFELSFFIKKIQTKKNKEKLFKIFFQKHSDQFKKNRSSISIN